MADASYIYQSMDESIRDALAHDSDVKDGRQGKTMTFLYKNSLNQSCSLQLKGSFDPAFSETWDIGSPTVVAAGTQDYDTLTDYWPYVMIEAICAIAPASGKMEIWANMRK